MSRDAIAIELEAVRKRHGGVLRPADVVEFAADPKTTLHGRFCWDDTEAARRYRLWQARDIIASVTIVPHSSSETRVRAYVALKPDRGGDSYRATVEVLSDEQMREQMLKDAFAELKAFRKKYAALKEVASVDATIRELRAAMRNARVGRRAA